MTQPEPPVVLRPRLVVRGADDAITFYREVFDAELVERFADGEGRVVHAALRIGTSTMSLTEDPAPRRSSRSAPVESPVLLHLTLPDPDRAGRRMLERGAHVIFPIADQFYGKREGRLCDPFGHLWILSRPIEDLDDAEIQRRLGAS